MPARELRGAAGTTLVARVVAKVYVARVAGRDGVDVQKGRWGRRGRPTTGVARRGGVEAEQAVST
jgi:hypothetical protein